MFVEKTAKTTFERKNLDEINGRLLLIKTLQSQSVSIKKLGKTLLYEKAACKMLVKLTPFFSSEIVKCQSVVIPFQLDVNLDRKDECRLFNLVDVMDGYVDVNFKPSCNTIFTHVFSVLCRIFECGSNMSTESNV